jgi:hypothetical protein
VAAQYGPLRQGRLWLPPRENDRVGALCRLPPVKPRAISEITIKVHLVSSIEQVLETALTVGDPYAMREKDRWHLRLSNGGTVVLPSVQAPPERGLNPPTPRVGTPLASVLWMASRSSSRFVPEYATTS